MPSLWAWPSSPPPRIIEKANTASARLNHGLFLLGAAVAGFCLFRWNPARSQLFPPCPFHWVTGLYCPGCGSLRALHALLHGQMLTAFRMNPLMLLSMPVLGLLVLRPTTASRPWVAWTAFAVLLGYGIVRNIPGWPFHLLAPPG
jgi:hypothetical protein